MNSLRALLVVSGLASLALAAPPPELPLETFFAEPDAQQVQISPDGRYIVLLAPHNDRSQIVVVDRKEGKRRRITDMKDENIVSVSWIKKDRLLFRQQVKGQESFGLYAVDPDGGNLRILQQATVLEGERVVNADDRRGFEIISPLPGDANDVLAAVVRGRSGLSDIYRINVRNDRRRIVMSGFGKVRDWVADRAGVVRVAVSQDENERTGEILYRSDEKSEWVRLAEGAIDAPGWLPVAFDGDNRTLIIVSDVGRSTRGLFAYDPEQRKIVRTLVDDPVYDVVDFMGTPNLLYSQKLSRVVGLRYDAERPTTVWFDPSRQKLQAGIDAALPTTVNDIVSITREEDLMVVYSYSDRDPGSYFLFDAKDNSLVLLARRFAGVDPEQMAEMRPFTYTARDGMKLYAYLTLPPGRDPKGLPMVIIPHGGPYGPRDSWGFDREAQFLANRGYIVLQTNFRGSGGYGRAYQEAGYRQWGLKMQDDLTDAVQWAIAQGYADANRVAIYGASYGGYATLAGLVSTPELYVCGVNYVGASDISRLGFMLAFNNVPKPLQEFLSRRWLHPLKDAEQIRATSPVNHVEKIQVPLLMAYGAYDPRVTLDHGTVLEAALKKHGKTYKNIVVENEGHGFGKLENRLNFYREMDLFFVEHLRPKRDVKIGKPEVLQMPARPSSE
jgi:dipeptidyl aminopeptidase/acylaminoacyl peptidase